MGGAEGVHYEYIAQRGVLLGQFVAILLLTLVETHVLEQHHLTGGHLHALEVILHQTHRFTQ